MIISPPFLPSAISGESDKEFVTRAMSGDAPGQGSFPVSRDLGWHGGLHLEAPAGTDGPLAVHAIADGVIVFMRRPTPFPVAPSVPAPDDPLNYPPGWTSDGVVIIRHRTEIGEGDSAKVEFYSIYMHLNDIERTISKDAAIYRKDKIGQAGYIYGKPHRIHFEIICDDTNLEKLIGRTTGTLDIRHDGRTDAVFGTMYFMLPAQTPIYADDLGVLQSALHEGNAAARQIAATRYAEARAAEPAYKTTSELFVGIAYESGSATVSTWQEDGTPVGQALPEPDAEYGLYNRANQLYPNCPSAGYELLRFGRVLGPDALMPADAAHWRMISYPGGQGWVDLRPDLIKKFSDADFPHWRGWFLIDDDTDGDSRADSRLLADVILDDGTTILDRTELSNRIATIPAVRTALARTICKIPSEWDDRSFDTRYAWLKDADKIKDTTLTAPFTEDQFGKLKAHLAKLKLWTDAGFTETALWHFEPRAFISIFRRCGWLSLSEFRQLLPSHAVRTGTKNKRTVVYWEPVPDQTAGEQSVTGLHRVSLNKTLRKYLVNTPMRQATFFGNALQETQWLSRLSEGSGSLTWYAPWYGRGFLQLTNPENYCNYWEWRGRMISTTLKSAMINAYKAIATVSPTSDRTNTGLQDSNFPELTNEITNWRKHIEALPDSDAIEERLTPSDSAGFYWSKNRMAKYADEVHTLERKAVLTDKGTKVYYRSQAFWRASASVNLPGAINRTNYLGLNGFDSRCCAYGTSLASLTEILFPNALNTLQLTFPEGYTPKR